MADAQHADAEATVEAPETFLAQQADSARPHAGVGTGGGAVRRQHACLEDPDGVGDGLGGGAGGEGDDEEVGRSQAVLLLLLLLVV